MKRRSILVLCLLCFSLNLWAANTIEDWNAKLLKNPSDKTANFELGKLYFSKDKDKALEYLQKGLNDNDPESYIWLAKLYHEQNKTLDEIRILNLLIPKHPNYPKAYTNLAFAYLKVGRLDDAIEKYRKAIEINPQYEAAHWGLLKVYEKKNNNYESRIILMDMLKLFGEKPKYLTLLCKLFSVDSFFEDSIRFCQKAIEVEPKVPENHVYLGLTYKYSENKQQAEKILKNAAKLFPKSTFAQQTAGEITLEAEYWEEASKYFQTCVKLDARNLICQMGLGKAAFNIGKYDISNNAFYQACMIDRKTVTEYKKNAAILRINKKTDWYNKFTANISKCY
jgi:tetratricopeptide (TPR) repeat protein